MLNISALQQYYGASHTLWDLELKVPAGSCVCLMGRNGVGKTTLLKAIMGLLPVADGSIQFDGVELAKAKAESRAEMGIGYVPQGREIFPLLTVEENLKTGLRAANKHGIKKVPDSIFEIFPVLKQMLKRRGGDLSGGQQQQLAIGRALVLNPRLLILDEPTEGIQPNIIQQIGRVIEYLKSRGDMAIILVEQYFDFAYGLADQFYVLKRGQVDLSGAKSALAQDDLRKSVSV